MTEDAVFADLLAGHTRTYVITALAQLRVADAMGGTPVSAEAVAGSVGVDAASLRRLLRSAAAIGLVTESHAGFALTSLGERLRGDHPRSQRGRALHVAGMIAPAFARLGEAVRTGSPPAGIEHGPDGFAALNDQPDAAQIFNQSMVDASRIIAARAADAYDFGRFAHIADVGGGFGAVLSTLLQRVAGARGTILDLEHARVGADALLAADGVADRASFVSGSFFDPIVVAADCYVLKWILHDWNDGYARSIVERVGAAARANDATVVLIERVLPEQVAASAANAGATAADLTMMLWGGTERTEAEFRKLLAHGGLELTRIVPLEDGQSVIEARPA
jgi:hypothetical protein